MPRTVVPLDHESGLHQVVASDAGGYRLAQQPVPGLRGKPDVEAVDRGGREAAGAKVVAGGRRLGGRTEAVAETFGRPGLDRSKRGFVVDGQAAPSTGQLDSGPIGQLLERLAELDLLHPHHEREHIAADVADPTAVRLPLGIDLEAGAGVVVPRAEPGHGLALPPQ